jgi:hypothetical protein
MEMKGFSLSWWLITGVDSVLGLLYHVGVDDVADTLKVHDASKFSIKDGGICSSETLATLPSST